METTTQAQPQNEVTGTFHLLLDTWKQICWIDKKQEWANLSDEEEDEEQQKNNAGQEGAKKPKAKKKKADGAQPQKKTVSIHSLPWIE